MKTSEEWLQYDVFPNFFFLFRNVFIRKIERKKGVFSLQYLLLWIACRVSRSKHGERAPLIACLLADTIEPLIFLFRIQRLAIS